MKKFTPALLALLLSIVAVTATTGCEAFKPQVDRQTYSAVNDTFITAVTVLNQARLAGEFDDAEWNDDVLPLIELGNDLLDDYDAATKAEVPAEPILIQVSTVLERLQPYIARANE